MNRKLLTLLILLAMQNSYSHASSGNSADVTQNGDDLTATVDQVTAVDNSSVVIHQVEDLQVVAVEQMNGSDLGFDLQQTSVAGNANQNSVDATQQGTANKAMLSQNGQGLTLTLVQDGSDNRIGRLDGTDRFSQAGTDNTALVDQSGNGNRITAVSQGGSDNTGTNANVSWGHGMEILQDGDGNAIRRVSQTGTQGALRIRQINNGNTNKILDVSQADVGNTLWVQQDGGNNNEISNVAQMGTDNTARIWQFHGGSGLNNTIKDVSQSGSSNQPSSYSAQPAVLIGGYQPVYGLDLYQDGDNHLMRSIHQAADNSVLALYQAGSNHVIKNISQTGDKNLLGITQTSNGNRVEMASQSGRDNRMDLLQSGNNNVAHNIEQHSNIGNIDGNLIELYQTSDNNELTVVQSGDIRHNTLRLRQEGVLGSRATVTDNGTGSTINLLQSGGGDHDIQLQVSGGSIAGNTVTVTQYDSSNSAVLNVSGNNNNLIVNQGTP